MEGTRIPLENIKDIILKLIDYLPLKVAISYIFIMLSWAFNGEAEVIIVVYSLIAIDTITGVSAVIKIQGWQGIASRKFFRSPVKFGIYLLFLYIARMVDKASPVTLAAPMMDAFLVTTEAVSILENFAKMGYPTPTLLINKLKTFFKDKEEK